MADERWLAASPRPLIEGYDALLVDLDGVVYLADDPIDGAAQGLAAARDAGVRIRFVTNNAARTPGDVANALSAMGVPAQPAEVTTSAVAAAQLLARRLPADAPVLVVGGVGVRAALSEAGLRPVTEASEQPVAVLQGFAPEVGWRTLAEAAVAIRAGASWVATNADRTLPSPRGPLPGNGSLVAALATATGETPEVIGKPEPALFRAAIEASGSEQPLMVGDRLDTDIAGARRAGLPALLVLTGVSQPADLVTAPPQARPTYLGRDLGALTVAHDAPRRQGDAMVCGTARARLTSGTVEVTAEDALDGLRALCALAWEQADRQADQRADRVDRDDRADRTDRREDDGRWDAQPYLEALETLDLDLR